jgi:hypothetical protein
MIEDRPSVGTRGEDQKPSAFWDIRDRGIDKVEVIDNGDHETPKPKISVGKRPSIRKSGDKGRRRTCELGF